MAGFGAAPLLVKIGLILTILGLVFHLIGFASPYWVSSGGYHSGLWRGCFPSIFGGTACGNIGTSNNPGKICVHAIYCFIVWHSYDRHSINCIIFIINGIKNAIFQSYTIVWFSFRKHSFYRKCCSLIYDTLLVYQL